MRHQASILKIQSDQLEEQRKINAEQTKVLALQVIELEESLAERKREAEQRHRAQASQVFIQQVRTRTAPLGYPEPEDSQAAVRATVMNSSEQPIYDVELRWHLGSAGYGDPEIESLGTMSPRSDKASIRWFPPGADMSNSGAVVRFTDAAGTRWLRRPDGYLNEFPTA